MTKQTVTSERWDGAQWIQVTSAVDALTAEESEALNAQDECEFLASCSAAELADYEAFMALARTAA
jgi:hypothetical protein